MRRFDGGTRQIRRPKSAELPEKDETAASTVPLEIQKRKRRELSAVDQIVRRLFTSTVSFSAPMKAIRVKPSA